MLVALLLLLAPRLDIPIPVAALASEQAHADGKFVVNPQTQVWLDGVKCKYQDVPGSAEIVSFDLAGDRRTILKIHFRSKR